MAGYLVNSLYAPIVPTFQRAFPNDTDAVVYFTYSPLNNADLVKKIHLSLVDQTTNENALADATGILIYDVNNIVEEGQSEIGFDVASNMYFVIIPKNALRDSTSWQINRFYKVQLRLDCTDGGTFGDEKSKTAYLQDNMMNFSEWSTVCLLRPILQPLIELRNFDPIGEDVNAYTKGILPISGQVFFGNGNSAETEILQSYVIDIYEKDGKTVVYTTGSIYTGDNVDPNNINTRINLQGLDTSTTKNFKLRITITTKNQYIMSQDFYFDIADFVEMTDFQPIGVHEDNPNDRNLYVDVNNEEGITSFRFSNHSAVYGTLHICRSSSISNFTIWEHIYEGHVNDAIDMTITDNTIGSHIWYQYSIQLENSAGGLSQVYYTDKFFPEFYDAFFSRGDMQLAIRYDFKVSSMKPVVNRAKMDTLGGKYPRFAENAVLGYKQFSISGIISAEADYNQLFLNKSKYFGKEYDNYRVYLSQNKIHDLVRNDSKDYFDKRGNYLTTTEDDWFWEREFREEAMKFLNDGEPKLFRSMTEGLIPVMLMDINLTPKAQLNRKLYDFTATMYEIADGHSLDELAALGIINVPRIVQELGGAQEQQPTEDYRTVSIPGQVYEFYPTDNNNIITSGIIYSKLMDRYAAGGVYSLKEAYEPYIKNTRIYFHTDPHMFLFGPNNSIQLIKTPTTEQLQSKRIKLGYTFQLQTADSIGWTTIFVNERGYYQIPNKLNVTGIAFNQYQDLESGFEGDRVTINYIITYKEKSSDKTIVSSQTIDRTIIGQYQSVFPPNYYLGEVIRARYNYITEYYEQMMQFWRGICLDVTPYAVAYIKYYNQNDYQEFVVGETGILHMLKDIPVSDMCFLGKYMVEKPFERQKYLDEQEYVTDPGTYIEIEEIKKPINNTVYNIGDKKYIYYHDAWEDFKDKGNGSGIAAVNIEGAINFLGDVVQINR